MSWAPPTVTAQVAPGFHPRSVPSSGDWVDLSPVLSYTISRGKQDTLSEFTNGTATIVLDNADFQLDQLIAGSVIESPDGLPSTPVRLKFVRNGTTKYKGPWYTVDGWNPGGDRWAATVTVPLSDWMGWAASQALPQSRWESWVTRERPHLYIRGDMSVDVANDGTVKDHRAYNMGQRWTGVYGDLVYNDTDYPDGQISRASSIVTGGNGPSMKYTSFLGTFAGMQANPLELISSTGTWMCCFWMKAPAGAKGLQYVGTVGGSNEWFIGTDAGGQIVATVTVSGTPYNATITADHCDDSPHLIALRVVSTGGLRVMAIGSDLGWANTSITPNAASGGGVVNLNADGDTQISDFCYWDTWPVCQDGTTSMAFPDFSYEWVNGTDLFGHQVLEDTTDRVAALGSYALVDDMPTLDLTMQTPGAYYEEYPPSATLEAAVKSLANANLGASYMLSDGTLRIRDGLYVSSDADDYDTVHALITDDPAAAGPPVVIRSKPERFPTRVDHLVNDVRVEGICYFFDVLSQQRYGVHAKSWGSGERLIFTDDIVDMAEAYMLAHKDPPVEFGNVSFSVWGHDDLATFVLDVLELDKRVGIRQATPDNVTELIDAEERIIGITESWTAGVAWDVSLALEPAA